MQNLIYHNLVDKSYWPAGPWQQEPDKEQFTDEATGLPCLLVRHSRSGHWCGYVGVNSTHPYFERGYDDCSCDVHGGLTFASKCAPHEMDEPKVCHIVDDGEDDNIWWLGFDCAHYGDASPAYDIDLLGDYKDVAYVKEQCRLLALQLAGTSLS